MKPALREAAKKVLGFAGNGRGLVAVRRLTECVEKLWIPILEGEVLHMAKRGHTQRQWEAKFFQCACACVYCGSPLTLKQATKDHFLPRLRGGSDAIENIGPVCWPCNQKKGNQTADEFRARYSTVPGFFTGVTTLAPGKPVRPVKNFSMIDSPSLHKLRKESEGVSWAWRNAARTA